MINELALQTAAVYSHQFDLEDDEVDLQALGVFGQAYAQAFGLHPESFVVGIRIGYLAELASRQEISLEEDTTVVEDPEPNEPQPISPMEGVLRDAEAQNS